MKGLSFKQKDVKINSRTYSKSRIDDNQSMIERNDERSHKSTSNDHESMSNQIDEIPELGDSVGHTISEFVILSHLKDNKDDLGFELIYSINEQADSINAGLDIGKVEIIRIALRKLNTRSDTQNSNLRVLKYPR